MGRVGGPDPQDLLPRASLTRPGKHPAQGSPRCLGKARGTCTPRGPNARKPGDGKFGLGQRRVEQETAEEGAGAPGTGTGAPVAGDVTAAAPRDLSQREGCSGLGPAGARGCRAPGAASELPSTFTSPGERNRNQMCHAREQLGDLLPPGTPSLPSPPATPPGPAPTCLPCDSLAGRPAAGGWESGLAGRRAGGGRWATRPRTWRTRLGRHSLPGGQGRKERQPRAPGRWARWREIPAVPTFPKRCATQGTVLPCSSLGRALLRAPAGWRRGAPPSVPLSPLPHTPTGTVGAAAPPTPSRACGRDPGGACPAPAQRPSSAQRPAVRPLAAGRAPGTQAASHHSNDAAGH